MKLAFVFNIGRLLRLNKYQRDEFPSEFFLGALEVKKHGHDVGFFECGERTNVKLIDVLFDSLYRTKLFPPKMYPGLIYNCRDILPMLAQYDAVVATTTGLSLTLGFEKFFGNLSKPLIAIHCGILNYPLNMWRRWSSERLLKTMWSQVYGYGEYEAIKEEFHLSDKQIEVNLFGVDTKFWQPEGESERSTYLLSVGNDSRRDYETFIGAALSFNYPSKIVTQLPISLPKSVNNIQIISGSWHTEAISDQELRRLYRESIGVVIPLEMSIQPSGQSVCLQAMACGKPVILTDTPGLWSKEGLEHMKNIIFVPPKDPGAIVRAVRFLLENPEAGKKMGENAREYVIKYGAIVNFADRLERYCRKAIESEKEKMVRAHGKLH